nr:hypothetical protein [Tanacetum cinerariifolium]
MLSLRNSNHDPHVDLYYPKGSDDYTEVTYDKEQCLSDRHTAHVTSPAYTPSIPFLATMEPADTFLMGDEVISTILAREINEFIKSSIDDLVPILRESELTLDSTDLEDIEELEHLLVDDPVLVPVPKVFDEPLGNSDSISRSFDVTFSNPPESTLVIDESSLLVTPLPALKQLSLREVERFDLFFSLTQSGEEMRVT